MADQQSLPMQLHTADYFEKTKALRGRDTWSPRVWLALFGGIGAVLLILSWLG